MSTILTFYDRQDMGTVPAEPDVPLPTTTTLYDLISALQTIVPLGEEEVVVALIVRWMRSGRIRVPRETQPWQALPTTGTYGTSPKKNSPGALQSCQCR